MGLTFIRLTSVHPVLVHITVGAAPLFVIAYGIGWLRRSRRWTFAGDVILVTAAAFTLATFAFGLVNNFTLYWPGGLSTWRGLHLAFGALSCALLVTFALVRIWRRRSVIGVAGLSCALLVAACIGWTGWIGGEVLTYGAGMAVAGAANGALAPQLNASAPRPTDLHSAMGDARFAWASVNTQLASAIVNHPTAADLSAIQGYARHLAMVGDWMQSSAKAPKPTQTSELQFFASTLSSHAAEMEKAASAGDLEAVQKAFSEVTLVCVGCHEDLRWQDGGSVSRLAPTPAAPSP